jgi:hypothetical protein
VTAADVTHIPESIRRASAALVLRDPVAMIVRLTGPVVARAASRLKMPGWLRDVLRRLAVIQFAWITEIMDLGAESVLLPWS